MRAGCYYWVFSPGPLIFRSSSPARKSPNSIFAGTILPDRSRVRIVNMVRACTGSARLAYAHGPLSTPVFFFFRTPSPMWEKQFLWVRPGKLMCRFSASMSLGLQEASGQASDDGTDGGRGRQFLLRLLLVELSIA